MPIYTEKEKTYAELIKLSGPEFVCGTCGEGLTLCWGGSFGYDCHILRCTRDVAHTGISRPFYLSPADIPGFNLYDAGKKRRESMQEKLGAEKSKALIKAKLPMSGALTQPEAEHILSLVYPGCPREEIIRCAILCRDFGLHPLMKEVYLIPFEKKDKQGKVLRRDWVTVVGITASRKMAADRKGAYSFLDGTPRAASHEEIVKQFGQNSEEERDNLISICTLRGEKGNEATGFGLWPKNKEPYGTDKGNTQRNMANIRSERPAYSRLPGGVLPPVEVIDEAYAKVPDVGKVDTETGEIIEGEVKELGSEPEPKLHWCEEHNCAYEKKVRGTSIWYAHKLPDGGWCNETKKKGVVPKAAPAPVAEAEEPTKPQRDPDTLKTINDLYKACNVDFNLQPAQVLAELNVNSQAEISDTPADCYRRILAVRQ
ncbi:hypothetical protein ES708_23965 [subsurface metagenome]